MLASPATSVIVAFGTGPFGVVSRPCACRLPPSVTLLESVLKVLVTGAFATEKLSVGLCASLYGTSPGTYLANTTCLPGAVVSIIYLYEYAPVAFVGAVATVLLSTWISTELFVTPVRLLCRLPERTRLSP